MQGKHTIVLTILVLVVLFVAAQTSVLAFTATGKTCENGVRIEVQTEPAFSVKCVYQEFTPVVSFPAWDPKATNPYADSVLYGERAAAGGGQKQVHLCQSKPLDSMVKESLSAPKKACCTYLRIGHMCVMI